MSVEEAWKPLLVVVVAWLIVFIVVPLLYLVWKRRKRKHG